MDKKTTDTKVKKEALNEKENEAGVLNKLKESKKMIVWLLVVILAVVIAILVFLFVNKSNSNKADIAIGEADNVELNDSIALSMYRNVAEMGHKAGERAKIESAIILYRNGQYLEAVDYLKDASVSDPIIETGVYSLLGDCYVNLEDYEQAIDAFEDAINIADGNPELTPLLLVKLAHVYRATSQTEKEAKCYQTIVDEYPQFGDAVSMDYTKYVERAKGGNQSAEPVKE